MGKSNVLRLISPPEGLVIPACTGERTIAQATDIFGYIDSDFKNWGTDQAGEATPQINAAVYGMERDANFATMFGSLASDPEQVRLTQDQIIRFVENHRDWLRKDGYATFFLFKINDEFFVAYVNLNSGGGLVVDLDRFGGGDVWVADDRRRVVVPQLTV